MPKEMKDLKVHILITALALDEEDVALTKQCYESFINCPTSFVKDVMVDPRLHGKGLALTAKWNEFINFYRSKDYDYLMLCANDTIAHPDALEYMVKWMEDNKGVDIMHPIMNRDRNDFDKSCKNYANPEECPHQSWLSMRSSDNDIIGYCYRCGIEGKISDKLDQWKRPDNFVSGIEYNTEPFFSPHETANMILRKGLVETVDEFDLLFPHERNEQDYFVRATRLGKSIKTANMKLFYHPDHSQDDPNRQGLSVADNNFQAKFGTDWFDAIEGGGYDHPFNNPELDWTSTKQNTLI